MLINQEQVKLNDNMSEEQLLTVGNDYWAQLANDLDGLKKDERFQRLILEGYFKDRPINAVFMLDAPGTDVGNKKDIIDELMSISKLQWYFKMVESLGSAPVEDTEE